MSEPSDQGALTIRVFLTLKYRLSILQSKKRVTELFFSKTSLRWEVAVIRHPSTKRQCMIGSGKVKEGGLGGRAQQHKLGKRVIRYVGDSRMISVALTQINSGSRRGEVRGGPKRSMYKAGCGPQYQWRLESFPVEVVESSHLLKGPQHKTIHGPGAHHHHYPGARDCPTSRQPKPKPTERHCMWDGLRPDGR
jgi:hypothetical protein